MMTPFILLCRVCVCLFFNVCVCVFVIKHFLLSSKHAFIIILSSYHYCTILFIRVFSSFIIHFLSFTIIIPPFKYSFVDIVHWWVGHFCCVSFQIISGIVHCWTFRVVVSCRAWWWCVRVFSPWCLGDHSQTWPEVTFSVIIPVSFQTSLISNNFVSHFVCVFNDDDKHINNSLNSGNIIQTNIHRLVVGLGYWWWCWAMPNRFPMNSGARWAFALVPNPTPGDYSWRWTEPHRFPWVEHGGWIGGV